MTNRRRFGSVTIDDRHAVLICSRGRPEEMTRVVMSLDMLAARPGSVIYAIRVDEDDADSIDAAERLGRHVALDLHIGPRPGCLGAEINLLAHSVNAGFYHVMNDDLAILTRDWDLKVRDMVDSIDGGRERVFCWNLLDVGSPDYPIIPAAWFNAAGDIFPERFRYWFDDLWLSHVAIMVHGGPVLRIDSCLVHTRKTMVRGMRDIAFWAELYMALEDERIEWAQEIADNLGLGIDIRTDRAADIAMCHQIEVKRLAGMVADAERLYGDKSEPDRAYLCFKLQMADLLDDIKNRETEPGEPSADTPDGDAYAAQ